MLKKHDRTTTPALQQDYKRLVKTEQTASRFWAKHVGSRYPQKAAPLTALREQGLQDLMQIVAALIHSLLQDRFFSSGKHTSVFYVPSSTITQYHRIRLSNYV